MKICSKCGETKENDKFVKDKNLCKDCANKRAAIYRAKNKDKIKAGQARYYNENRDKVRKNSKEYYLNNRDEMIAKKKVYYTDHKKHLYQKSREFVVNNPELVAKYHTRYRANNKDSIRKSNAKYTNTPKGKEFRCKVRNARKILGHSPINEKFTGSVEHHLKYSNTVAEQDFNITIYAPRKLHDSVRHNGKTGKNMKTINMLLLEWYLNNTSEDKRNKQAVLLYWNYCTLPEPVWNADNSIQQSKINISV